MNKALRNPLIYIVLCAGILAVSGFFIYPIFTAFDNSFTSWNGISKDVKYIGFDNYVTALNDDAFGRLSGTTFISFSFPV